MTENEVKMATGWLHEVPLLQDLTLEIHEKIARHMQVGFVEPNKNIITFGEPGDALYFVEEGGADALVQSQVVMSYKRGGHFGELALITDEPRKATVRANAKGCTLLRLDRAQFEDTLNLKHRSINLLNFADRSPITTVPHAKVARAFDIFRKLGMRHMCVVDSETHVVGILTRKDLMTYRIAEHIMPHRVEVMIRDWLYRWRKRRDIAKRQQAPPSPSQALNKDAVKVHHEWNKDDQQISRIGAHVGVKMGKWREHAARAHSFDASNLTEGDPPIQRAQSSFALLEGEGSQIEQLEEENAQLKRELADMRGQRQQILSLLGNGNGVPLQALEQ